MSAGSFPTTDKPARPRMTFGALAAMKDRGEPIAMVTAYDYPSAQIAEEAGVDMVLVGDSTKPGSSVATDEPGRRGLSSLVTGAC